MEYYWRHLNSKDDLKAQGASLLLFCILNLCLGQAVLSREIIKICRDDPSAHISLHKHQIHQAYMNCPVLFTLILLWPTQNLHTRVRSFHVLWVEPLRSIWMTICGSCKGSSSSTFTPLRPAHSLSPSLMSYHLCPKLCDSLRCFAPRNSEKAREDQGPSFSSTWWSPSLPVCYFYFQHEALLKEKVKLRGTIWIIFSIFC